MFYRHQVYRQHVNGAEAITQVLKEARATIARLKKKRRKDKAIIQELSEIIHEQNFLLQHNDQYMLDLENQLEAVLHLLIPKRKKIPKRFKENLEWRLDLLHLK
jgi:hypothetical protein